MCVVSTPDEVRGGGRSREDFVVKLKEIEILEMVTNDLVFVYIGSCGDS